MIGVEYLFDQTGKPLSMPQDDESEDLADTGEVEISGEGEEGEGIDEGFDEPFPEIDDMTYPRSLAEDQVLYSITH